MKVINRSRRRMENKQSLIMIFLLPIALLSFILGAIIGWGRGDKTDTVPPVPVAPVSVSAPTPVALPAANELTFYDTLPKGEQVSLGSGINLPPEAPAPIGRQQAAKTAAVSAAVPPAPKTEPPAPAKMGSWMVQFASYKAAEDARKMREYLAGKGYIAAVRAADLGAKGKWYRVVLGPYPSEAEAGRVAGRLQKEEKVTCLVRKD